MRCLAGRSPARERLATLASFLYHPRFLPNFWLQAPRSLQETPDLCPRPCLRSFREREIAVPRLALLVLFRGRSARDTARPARRYDEISAGTAGAPRPLPHPSRLR